MGATACLADVQLSLTTDQSIMSALHVVQVSGNASYVM